VPAPGREAEEADHHDEGSRMTKLRADQWAGIAGIVTGVLFFASALVLPLADYPASDGPASDVAEFIADHRGGVMAGILMNAFGSAGMVIFFAGLRQRLGDAWSELGFATGVFTVAIFTTGFAGFIAAAYRVDVSSPETVQAFSDFAWAAIAISSVPTILAFVLFGVSILSTGRLPAWLAWAGFAAALLHVGAILAFTSSSGALSLQGDFAKWVPVSAYVLVLAQGIALLRAKEE
jgi:hypothetical protein